MTTMLQVGGKWGHEVEAETVHVGAATFHMVPDAKMPADWQRVLDGKRAPKRGPFTGLRPRNTTWQLAEYAAVMGLTASEAIEVSWHKVPGTEHTPPSLFAHGDDGLDRTHPENRNVKHRFFSPEESIKAHRHVPPVAHAQAA